MEIGMAQQKVFSDCPLHRLHIWSQLHISWDHHNSREFANPLNTVLFSPIIGVGKGEKIGIVRPKQWVLWQLP
jgi:hypothetical protein